MFAGYGGAEFALKKAGVDYEVVGFSEIDPFAIKAYNLNHGEITNYGDCTTIDPETIPDFDLLTGGFPCQAFSVAGKNKGELDTRGTLFYDIVRIAEAKKPEYLLLENVEGILSKAHRHTFNKIVQEFRRIGYDVAWKVLNSKDYGIPQSRSRVWFVCKRGKWAFGEFVFPRSQELKLFLKDILEPCIDDKYYLSSERVDKLLEGVFLSPEQTSLFGEESSREEVDNVILGEEEQVSFCLDANYFKGPAINDYFGKKRRQLVFEKKNEEEVDQEVFMQDSLVYPVNDPARGVKNMNGRRIKSFDEAMFTLTAQDRHGVVCVNYADSDVEQKKLQNRVFHPEAVSPCLTVFISNKTNIIQVNNPVHSQQRVYSPEGISPTIMAGNKGGGKEPTKIVQINNPVHSNNRVYSGEGLAPTLRDMSAGGSKQPFVLETPPEPDQALNKQLRPHKVRVRKLTPKECFRLMGFLDDEITLEGISNSQQYKLAGNGWEINVVSLLFRELYKNHFQAPKG